MPKTKISEFSATPANNTDIDSINIAEGCAPSGINDAIRELMAQLKDFQTGAVGDSFNGPVGTTTAAAGAFTTLSASGNLTLSGGTANGVAYLNGSKVVTSGSALTFDGSNVGVTASSSAGFVGITTQNTSAGAGASSGIGINNDSTAATYLRTYGSGQTNTLLGSVIANYTALLSDGAASNGILLGSITNKPIIFGVNNAEVGRFTSTGLGIGTSSPAYKLDVAGSSGFIAAQFKSSYSATARIGSDNAQAWFGQGTNGINTSFIVNDTSGSAFIQTAGTLKATLDSSGNLGLGVTPSAGLATANYRLFEIGLDGGGSIYSGTNQTLIGTNIAWSGGTPNYKRTGSAPTLYNQQNGSHSWSTAPSGTAGNAITFTQAMSLDADGWWYLGTTSTSTAGNAIVAYANSVAGQFSIGHANGTSSGNSYVGFQYNGSTIGSITQSGTTAVLYNVTSDKRLKNDLGVVKNTDVIANTVIHDFTWKSDGSQSRGVFAQEAAKTLPSAVKVGDEGKEVTEQWQVDYSKYIPDIIVELQSLRARVAELEAK